MKSLGKTKPSYTTNALAAYELIKRQRIRRRMPPGSKARTHLRNQLARSVLTHQTPADPRTDATGFEIAMKGHYSNSNNNHSTRATKKFDRKEQLYHYLFDGIEQIGDSQPHNPSIKKGRKNGLPFFPPQYFTTSHKRTPLPKKTSSASETPKRRSKAIDS